MNKKVITVIIVIILAASAAYSFRAKGAKNTLSNPLTALPQISKTVTPSETVKEYTDPSGFSFNYPDNLSLTKNDITDNSTYADLQLSSKEVNGSLSLKIVDSQYKTLEEWIRANQIPPTQTPKEVKLGNLPALEINQPDRLILAALDKGILFTIEIPTVEQTFWAKVYNKFLSNFAFAAPDTSASQSDTSSSDITFEGEEVVE